MHIQEMCVAIHTEVYQLARHKILQHCTQINIQTFVTSEHSSMLPQ